MKIVPSIDHVLHLEFDTQSELTHTMARISEFFESPFNEIKGKYFSWSDFDKAYLNYSAYGLDDYFTYYEGFNLPKKIIGEFFELFTDLTPDELKLKDICDMNPAEYLIATFIGGDPTTLEHELAHARYTLDYKYNRLMVWAILEIPTHHFVMLRNDLKAAGYSGDHKLLMDELHAYLLTSNEEELTDVFKSVPLEDLLFYQHKLSTNFKEYLLCATSKQSQQV